MVMRLDRSALLQTDFDSGALRPLAAVVRQFRQPGGYIGTILRGEQPVGTFYLEVALEEGPVQVDVNLSATAAGQTGNRPGVQGDCGCGKDVHAGASTGAHLRLRAEGYALFHVTQGAGYAVHVGPAQAGEAGVWDSRELQEGDLFAVTLLRPGRYRATETSSGGEAAIRVAYPRPGERRGKKDEATTVEAGGRQGIRPKRLELEAADAHAYRIAGPSRIRIELQEPDDGPRPVDGGPRYRWRRVGPQRPTGRPAPTGTPDGSQLPPSRRRRGG